MADASPFLSLPGELRNRIYRYLVPPPGTLFHLFSASTSKRRPGNSICDCIHMRSDSTHRGCDQCTSQSPIFQCLACPLHPLGIRHIRCRLREIETDEYCHCDYKEEIYGCQQHVEYHKTDTAILRVCRQTHYESSPMFYGNSAFCFWINTSVPSPVDVVSWLSALTPIARNSIQTLKILGTDPPKIREPEEQIRSEELQLYITRVAEFANLVAHMKVQRLAIDFGILDFDVEDLDIFTGWIRPFLELGKLSHIVQLHVSFLIPRHGGWYFPYDPVEIINCMGDPYSANYIRH